MRDNTIQIEYFCYCIWIYNVLSYLLTQDQTMRTA